jgi:hypothetical protein
LTEKGRAKATTPTRSDGTVPTPYGNASYLKRSHHYLNLIHPWTTGFARAKINTWYWVVIPQAQGYDISLGGVDITVPHYDWNWNWNKTLSTITPTTQTYKQYLKGVTRVVSMVRPRLVWTFSVPPPGGVLNPKTISNIWQTAWIWRLKVFFLPEPTGLLLLGVGIAVLLGVSRTRRR